MIEIIARHASLEFPVYDSRRRSLRHALIFDHLSKPFKRNNRPDLVGGKIGRNERGQVVINALEDLSFELHEGDRVGLIGHNGAGKSTLLKTLAGIYEPLYGELIVRGKVTPLFNLNDGIDMDATGLEAIHTRGIMLGMSPKVIAGQVDDIAEFTELGDYLYMPIRTYSTGMLVRLAFAVATTKSPEILLMDELIGAGDAHFVERAQQRLKSFVASAGIMVVASHSMEILRQWCNKAILLHKGRIAEFGEVEVAIKAYEKLVAAG